jgi:chromosome partitioning protein
MQIIALASQKGGAGKTTLAGHLAVEAERVGAGPVALIDADPQGSLADWWNERKAETPAFVQTSLAGLRADIDRLRDLGIKLLIIDTPPAITSTIAEVVKLADLVVIPTRPSPHDLRAVAKTVDLVEDLYKPMVFVVNAASSRAKITTQAVIALSQHGTLSPAIIHQRTDFASSMIDGRTVMEIGRGSPSTTEIGELWKYIQERLARTNRPPLAYPVSRQAVGYG